MDEIHLESYDTRWPTRFEAEATLLRSLLPPTHRLRIEHFGSTAVPGLAAKPVIDILVAVRSLEAAIDEAIPLLESVGYSFWRDNPDKTRLFLVKGLPPSAPQRTHHLHIAESDSDLWERLLFRDYLRAHPDEAARYAALKRELAASFPDDREAYTQGKSQYIAGVMASARRGISVKIDRLDHLVLTVADIDATCAFYERILGMERVETGGRTALRFGIQKINLHQVGHEFSPRAHQPTPGSADLCFISAMPLEEAESHLTACGVAVLQGPVERTGATGKIVSVYFRDPDQNLIEVSTYTD